MFDCDFNEFLDSDDDEFFVKASSALPDYDLSPESAPKAERDNPHTQQNVVTSSYFELQGSDSLKVLNYDIDFESNKPTSMPCENSNNDLKIVSSTSTESDFNSIVTDSNKRTFTSNNSSYINKQTKQIILSKDVDLISKKSTLSRKNSCNDLKKEASASANSDHCNVSTNLKKSTFTPETSSYMNKRFTPGFTPKAKKRKFVGPAGLVELFDESNEENPVPCGSNKMASIDVEFEHIVSSQFSPEHLSLLSWQKLQTSVSSHSNLHSTAKYYSIQRVIQESSKKKLPKHMVVPVLCVLVKKISTKGASAISVFMDDTGEINGKIDADVLTNYKGFMVEGTALILKEVTFLCNVLILKEQNLVSMYQSDGTEKHLQTLESVLDAPEPLKPMNCECLKLSHSNIKNNTSTIPHNIGVPGQHKIGCVSHTQNRTKNISLQKKVVNKIVPASKSLPSTSKEPASLKIMRSNAVIEDLLSEDNCLDEFDELLGNLDEKSFMDCI